MTEDMVTIKNRAVVKIRPFHPSDQAHVKALILAGLQEHWGILDTTLNPDLNDIATSYGPHTFLIAEVKGQIVGTGALIHEAEGIGRIVRMSVDCKMRRLGIGRQLLKALIAAAALRGYDQIVLETTSTWHDATAFYQKNGFQVVGMRDGDTHFTLNMRVKTS